MTTSIPQQVAIVIGGASGIGEAVVERLARDHWIVIVADSDELERLGQQVADNLRAAGREAYAETVDVADEGEVAAMIEATSEFQGGLHAIVQCASCPPQHLETLLKHGANEIEQSGGGAIVFVTDDAQASQLARDHSTPRVRVHALATGTFRILDEIGELLVVNTSSN